MAVGTASPNYGTGRSVMSNGYVRLWRPGHPMANSDGYALEHRLVLHDAGVEIPDGSHVHHCNGVKSDNRLVNLEVKSAARHASDHVRDAGFVINQFGAHSLVGQRECERCGASFKPWSTAGRFCSRACANRRSV